MFSLFLAVELGNVALNEHRICVPLIFPLTLLTGSCTLSRVPFGRTRPVIKLTLVPFLAHMNLRPFAPFIVLRVKDT